MNATGLSGVICGKVPTRVLAWGLAALAMLASPLAALAARDDVEREIYDARLEGYTNNMTLEGGSVGFMYVLLILLTIVCIAPLFMNARRSHLD